MSKKAKALKKNSGGWTKKETRDFIKENEKRLDEMAKDGWGCAIKKIDGRYFRDITEEVIDHDHIVRCERAMANNPNITRTELRAMGCYVEWLAKHQP